MCFRFLLSGFCCCLALAAAGQTGAVTMGSSSPGEVMVGSGTKLGTASLPVCTAREYACTVTYIFTGNGYWTQASNWQAGVVPPSVLPAGRVIIIDPQSGGECILNVPQTISAGATFVLQAPKRFRVMRKMVFLK